MKTTRTAAAILTLSLISACAQGPDAIQPVSMGSAFASISCTQAREMLVQERQTLATLSTAQQNAATGDALGVFLIGVPVSSMTGGDKAGDIGASKGKILALEARLVSC